MWLTHMCACAYVSFTHWKQSNNTIDWIWLDWIGLNRYFRIINLFVNYIWMYGSKELTQAAQQTTDYTVVDVGRWSQNCWNRVMCDSLVFAVENNIHDLIRICMELFLCNYFALSLPGCIDKWQKKAATQTTPCIQHPCVWQCYLIKLICIIYSNQLHYLGTSLSNNSDSNCKFICLLVLSQISASIP